MDRSWHIRVAPAPLSAKGQLAREQAVLAEYAVADDVPLAMVWESEPALVVSPADRNLPEFANAAQLATQEGWPVCARPTGGSAVALASGVVNVALVHSWSDERPSLEEGYQLICAPLIATLSEFGLAAATGSAPRAFCDGRYNVLVGGRKIAGTSQRHASRAGRGAVLMHATVLIRADPSALTAVVSRFYERAGRPRELHADAVTSASGELGVHARQDLVPRFIATLSGILRGK